MRTDPHTQVAWWGTLTALGFAPALVMLWLANYFHHLFGWVWILFLRLPVDHVFANQVVNTWLLALAAAAYTVWILAVARRWITTATGGGFLIASLALILRIVVELPQSLVQTPLAERLPPEPYATVLPLARTLGMVGFVAGLGFVLAATLSELRLRRTAPSWAIPP